MINKITRDTQNNADEKLTASVTHTLDKSLDDIDDLSLQRLKNARVNALAHSSKPSRKWVSLSIAASLTALLLIPVVTHQSSVNTSVDQDLEIVSQEVPFSSEEMDDIEMLMALEGSDA